MSILAIDTASRSRVVCVLASPQGELIDAAVIRGQPVGTSLPRMLMRMLDAADHAVVVVTGPGTYTGVRAGMAAALGIADARGSRSTGSAPSRSRRAGTAPAWAMTHG